MEKLGADYGVTSWITERKVGEALVNRNLSGLAAFTKEYVPAIGSRTNLLFNRVLGPYIVFQHWYRMLDIEERTDISFGSMGVVMGEYRYVSRAMDALTSLRTLKPRIELASGLAALATTDLTRLRTVFTTDDWDISQQFDPYMQLDEKQQITVRRAAGPIPKFLDALFLEPQTETRKHMVEDQGTPLLSLLRDSLAFDVAFARYIQGSGYPTQARAAGLYGALGLEAVLLLSQMPDAVVNGTFHPVVRRNITHTLKSLSTANISLL